MPLTFPPIIMERDNIIFCKFLTFLVNKKILRIYLPILNSLKNINFISLSNAYYSSRELQDSKVEAPRQQTFYLIFIRGENIYKADMH